MNDYLESDDALQKQTGKRRYHRAHNDLFAGPRTRLAGVAFGMLFFVGSAATASSQVSNTDVSKDVTADYEVREQSKTVEMCPSDFVFFERESEPVSRTDLPVWARSLLPVDAYVYKKPISLGETGDKYWLIAGGVYGPQSYTVIAGSIRLFPVSLEETVFSNEIVLNDLIGSTSNLEGCRAEQLLCLPFDDLKNRINLLSVDDLELPHKTTANLRMVEVNSTTKLLLEITSGAAQEQHQLLGEFVSFDEFHVECILDPSP